jgi:hypothetical protein
MKIEIDSVKRFFILLSYISYVILTILNNNLKIHNQYVDYIFLFIIGLSLKIADSTSTIKQIINNVDLDKFENIITRTESIISNSTVIPITDRSVQTPERDNEPFNIDTHRDISLNSQYVLRIKNNNIV